MIYEVKNVRKTYDNGELQTKVLSDIHISIEEGSFITILGPSGSGKTTLLNVLSGLDHEYEGEILFQGKQIKSYSEKQMVQYRKKHISFVFQQYHLLPTLNVIENVEIARELNVDAYSSEDILEKVDLLEHKHKYPNQLSGGQKQRVAIARAIVKAPRVIFCDEPTGALDSKSAKHIMSLLLKLNKLFKITIVMVTHHQEYTKLADHIIYMQDGKIQSEQRQAHPLSVNEMEW